MARAQGENFPVASRLLGRRERADLLAIYGFARLVDELGDRYEGDRLKALDWVEAELDRAFAGAATHPLLIALQPTLRARALARAPFVRLIEANRLDQRVSRYRSWEELRDYCRLSADPVGELVLAVFGVRDATRIALSDSICTALQLTEHCQDIAEDLAHGRIYLPSEELARFGVSEADLAQPSAGPHVRRLIAFEVERARTMLDDGAPLIAQLPLRAALAVAAFAAGGRAALAAIERREHDVLAGPPRASRRMLALAFAAALADASRQLRPLAGRRRRSAARAGARMSAIEQAYAECEAITRTRAANFYWGIRLLAPARRRALSAAYALARRVDDIGDGELPREEKLRGLAAEEAALAEIARGTPPPAADPVLLALADAHARFSLPLEAFLELIEGVRMDVLGVSYETFDELVLYCRRVAGAIGRICLAIFALRGSSSGEHSAQELADDLGVALQLTNILRDVREDAEHGRVYLPAADLRSFGLLNGAAPADAPARLAELAHAQARPGDANGRAGELERLRDLVRFEAHRADQWFERGLGLLPLLDRRSSACVVAMAGIYRRLLERIEEDPAQVLMRRVSLRAHEKAWVAARGMLGRGA
jgi:phytoene synthase